MFARILQITLLFLLISTTGYGQIDGFPRKKGVGNRGNQGGIFRPGANAGPKADSARVQNQRNKDKLRTYPMKLYRYYSIEEDSVPVDTSLTIRNHFKINFLQKDSFGLIPFQNMGQPVNNPLYLFEMSNFDPVPIAKAGFFSRKDLPFFHVPTPYSRLFFLTGNKKGQMLDSKFGTNIRPDWNIGAGYRGLSSLGYYKHTLSDHENWFVNTDMMLPGNHLFLRFYLIKNHLKNDENGGIADEQFFTNSTTYSDRSRMPVISEKDFSTWHSRETGIAPEWFFSKSRKGFSLGYAFDYLKAYFKYEGGEEVTGSSPLPHYQDFDSTGYRDYQHRFFVRYRMDSFRLETAFEYRRYFNNFDSARVIGSTVLPAVNLWTFRTVSAKIGYQGKNWSNRSKAAYEFSFGQYDLSTQWQYGKHLSAQWGLATRLANPVFLVHQSRFPKFNWLNSFQRVRQNNVRISYRHRPGRISVSFRQTGNPVYFSADSLPAQYPGKINLVQVEYEKDWHWKKFGLYSRIRWQRITPDNPAVDAPEWIVRGALYYEDRWFTRHMHLQTGFSVDYFSDFYLPGYNPLLNTFFQQRNKRYGNYYIADLFFDFKVKKFRAYLKLGHFNAFWERSKPAYFSAPFNPFADVYTRLGIIWQFVN